MKEILYEQRYEARITTFKRFLPWIIWIICAVILIIFIYDKCLNNVAKYNAKAGNTLMDNMVDDTHNLSQDIDYKDLASNIWGKFSNIKDLMLLQKILYKITNKQYDDAKLLLSDIIEDDKSRFLEMTKRYACIVWMSLVVDQADISNLDLKTFYGYTKFFKKESDMFFGSASIIEALMYLRTAQTALAENVLNRILTINNIPQNIKDQAVALLFNINIKSNLQ